MKNKRKEEERKETRTQEPALFVCFISNVSPPSFLFAVDLITLETRPCSFPFSFSPSVFFSRAACCVVCLVHLLRPPLAPSSLRLHRVPPFPPHTNIIIPLRTLARKRHARWLLIHHPMHFCCCCCFPPQGGLGWDGMGLVSRSVLLLLPLRFDAPPSCVREKEKQSGSRRTPRHQPAPFSFPFPPPSHKHPITQ